MSRLYIERDASQPNEFELLFQIVEEIEEDLKKTKNFDLQKALQNQFRRRNWSSSLLQHLNNVDELKSLIKAFKEALNLEICFLIDVTGSIAEHYDHFKNQVLTAILEAVLNNVNKGSKRYAYIGYRERDEEHEFHQFTENLDQIRDAIRNTVPKGGGDGAEDVEFALDLFKSKIKFSRAGTRLIIHVADAPCHGKRYHEDNITDNHPEWSDKIPGLLEDINNNFGCFYWFVKITDNTDKMITEFNRILSDTSGDDPDAMSIEQINLKMLKGNLKKFFESMLQKTILASVAVKQRK